VAVPPSNDTAAVRLQEENSFQDLATGGGGAQEDPPYKTWRGQHYDFHDVCDLILLQSKEFEFESDLVLDATFVRSCDVRCRTFPVLCSVVQKVTTQ
jgi:hypothetical protein